MADGNDADSSHQAKNGGSGRAKQTSTLARKRFSAKKVVTWSAGVLATALAAVLVAAITGGAHVIWSTVSGPEKSNDPLVISPAKIKSKLSSRPKSISPRNHLSRMPKARRRYEVYTQVKKEYFLKGNISISDLPKISELRHRATLPPITSWILDLNVLGKSSSPVIITGMSVHVLNRSPSRTVTAIDSCWRLTCTPRLEPRGPLVLPMSIRYVSANLDTPALNIRVKSDGPHNFPFLVNHIDDEFFSLHIHASQCTCQWVVYVDWLQGEHAGRKLFDNNGLPFQITTDTIARRYCYDSGHERGYAAISNRESVRRVCEK